MLLMQGSVVFVSHQQLPLRDHVLTQVSSQSTIQLCLVTFVISRFDGVMLS